MKFILLSLIVMGQTAVFAECYNLETDGEGIYRATAKGQGDIALIVGRGARKASEIAFENGAINANTCAIKYCEKETGRFCERIGKFSYGIANRSGDTYTAEVKAMARAVE